MPSLSIGPIGPELWVRALLDAALDGSEDACVRALAATSIWAIIANVKGTCVIAAVLTVALSLAGRVISADEVVVELVGFLGNLPAGEVRLPLSGVTTARLEVPNELGGSRVAFTVEFTMHTEFARDAAGSATRSSSCSRACCARAGSGHAASTRWTSPNTEAASRSATAPWICL